MRKRLRLFVQTLGFGGKARFQGLGLFETATLLHALLLSVTGGGSAPGVLITDRYQRPRDDGQMLSSHAGSVCPADDTINKNSIVFNKLLTS
jgi:hypothetical protein